MDKEYLTKITNDLYRLTLLFPKKEPLRYKMRELADNVLSNLVLVIEGSDRDLDIIYEIKRNIEPLNVFFNIAKDQNWVNPDEISEIQDKFLVIKEELEEFRKNLEETKTYQKKEVLPKSTVSFASFNPRQKKIVEMLKKTEKIQVGDVQKKLPEVTKRTLRRDFDLLMKEGVIKRSGKANLTYYHLASSEA